MPRRDVVEHQAHVAVRGGLSEARRTLRGIDEQIRKAQTIAAGYAQVKRNRFLTLTDEHREVNRQLELKARGLAGFNGYITSLLPDGAAGGFGIGAYHQLWHVEKCLPMSKHDLATTLNAIRGGP